MSQEKPGLPSAAQAADMTPAQKQDFLQLEYDTLNDWARHGENAAHSIFNFYVTLITASLAAFLVTAQLLGGSTEKLLIVIAGISALLSVVGSVFLDALVSQYSRNSIYRLGIQAVRAHFQRDPEIAAVLTDLPKSTLERELDSSWDRRLLFGRLSFVRAIMPLSTQVTFVAMLTSLLLGVWTWSLIWLVGGVGYRPTATAVGSAVVVVVTFAMQNIYTRLSLREVTERLRKSREPKA